MAREHFSYTKDAQGFLVRNYVRYENDQDDAAKREVPVEKASQGVERWEDERADLVRQRTWHEEQVVDLNRRISEIDALNLRPTPIGLDLG